MGTKTSKLGIMNIMGAAAHKKSQTAGQTAAPEDDTDPVNSETPKSAKSPAAPKMSGKQVAAIKAKAKGA